MAKNPHENRRDLYYPSVFAPSRRSLEPHKVDEALKLAFDLIYKFSPVGTDAAGNPLDLSLDATPDGSALAAALTAAVQTFSTDIVFSATDNDTVQWTAGDIVLQDGNTYAISAGNTGNMTVVTYIYLDVAVSTTVLQTTTDFNAVIDEDVLLLCIANDVTAGQEAFFVPAVGVFGINETVIGANSISTAKIQASAITTDKLNANSVTAAKIAALTITAAEIAANAITTTKLNANAVTAAKADLTDIFAQTITASGTITGATLRTASSGSRIEMDSTNGFRAYNGGGTLTVQIPVSGGNAGILLANTVQSLGGTTLTLQNTGSQEVISLDGSSNVLDFFVNGSGICRMNSTQILALSSIDFVVQNGRGFTNTSGNASLALPSGASELYGSSGIGLQCDGADSGSNTGILVQGDGSLRRVTIDNSDLGTGAKRYLYLA